MTLKRLSNWATLRPVRQLKPFQFVDLLRAASLNALLVHLSLTLSLLIISNYILIKCFFVCLSLQRWWRCALRSIPTLASKSVVASPSPTMPKAYDINIFAHLSHFAAKRLTVNLHHVAWIFLFDLNDLSAFGFIPHYHIYYYMYINSSEGRVKGQRVKFLPTLSLSVPYEWVFYIRIY